MKPRHAAIAAVMQSQHALIGRAQAIDLGMSERQIDSMLAKGWWTSPQVGAYKFTRPD